MGGNNAELTGHTALCLVSLVGFFVYTASYSLVYRLSSNGGRLKPVAVVEMWMVLTHLLCAGATCVLLAVFGLRTAEYQTGLFLGVALAVTTCALGCLQQQSDAGYCNAYFPAAAWAPIAAAGAIAWAWIVYVASLGCQPAYVSLGLSPQHLLAPMLLVLLGPSVLSTLHQTCGYALPAPSLALHVLLVIVAFVLWTLAPALLSNMRWPLKIVGAVVLALAALLSSNGLIAWLAILGVGYSLLSQSEPVAYLSALLFGSSTLARVPKTGLQQQLHLH